MLYPLVPRPAFAIALAVAIVAVLSASVSVAVPVALAGAPTILIALLGRNPFPHGAISLMVFAWTAVAILLALTREEDALPARAVLSVPVVASLALFALMTLRLGASPSSGYGSVKIRLFLAENLTLLVAGIIIGRRRRHMNIYVALTLVYSTVAALVLAKGLVTGHGLSNLAGRFSLYEDESPIGLARDASLGLIVAVYVLLWSRSGFLRLFAFVAAPLIAVAFFAAGSRGPVLGFVVGLVVLLAVTLRDPASRRRIALLSLAAPIAAVAAIRLVPGADLQRSLSFLLFGGGGNTASNGRYLLWHQAWDAFHAHPLLGLGTGAFASINPELYPHNLFLEMAAELGFLGVVLVGLIVVSGSLRLGQVVSRATGEDRGHGALAAGLLAAALVNALVSSDITGNHLLWLAVGFGVGLTVRRAPATSEAAEPAPLQAAT
ncbi:MAG: O-antigen ligase family protein [Gaiellaceae bacterium]